jgi:hypothetical protein
MFRVLDSTGQDRNEQRSDLRVVTFVRSFSPTTEIFIYDLLCGLSDAGVNTSVLTLRRDNSEVRPFSGRACGRTRATRLFPARPDGSTGEYAGATARLARSQAI